MRNLSVDIETKVQNDLDEKIHGMAETLVHRPELVKLLNKNQPNQASELVFAYYVLYMCPMHSTCARGRYLMTINRLAGCDG
jgi:hypothetical protein